MTTTINAGQAGEWTAGSLRPTARWVAVPAAGGRVRMEMVWSVPSVTVADVVTAGGARTDGPRTDGPRTDADAAA